MTRALGAGVLLLLGVGAVQAAQPVYDSATRVGERSWRFGLGNASTYYYWDSAGNASTYGISQAFPTQPKDEFDNAISLDTIPFPLTATNIVIFTTKAPSRFNAYLTNVGNGSDDSTRGDAISDWNAVWHIQDGVTMQWTGTHNDAYVPVRGKPDVRFVFEEGSELLISNSPHTWATGSLVSARTNIVLRGARVNLAADSAKVYRHILIGTLLVKASAVPSVITSSELGLGFNAVAAAGGKPVIIVEEGGVLRIDAPIRTGAASFIKRGGGALVIARSSDYTGTIDVEEGSLEFEGEGVLPNATINVSDGARAGRALTESLADRETDYVHDADEMLSIHQPLALENTLDVRRGGVCLSGPGALPAQVKLGDGVIVTNAATGILDAPALLAGAPIRLDASRCTGLASTETLPNIGTTGGAFVRKNGSAVTPGQQAFGRGRPTLTFNNSGYLLTGFTNDTTDITVFMVSKSISKSGNYKKVFTFVDTDDWKELDPNSKDLNGNNGTNKFVYYEYETWNPTAQQYNVRALGIGKDPDGYRQFSYKNAAIKPLYDWRAPVVETVEIFSNGEEGADGKTHYRCEQYGALGDFVTGSKVREGWKVHHHTSMALGGYQTDYSGSVKCGAAFDLGELIVFFRRLDPAEKDELVTYLRHKWLDDRGADVVTMEVPSGATASATVGSAAVTNLVKTGAGTLVCREAGSLSRGRVEVRAGTLAFDTAVAEAAAVLTPGVALALYPNVTLGYLNGFSRVGALELPEGGTVYARPLARIEPEMSPACLLKYDTFTANGGAVTTLPGDDTVRVAHDASAKTFSLKVPKGLVIVVR